LTIRRARNQSGRKEKLYLIPQIANDPMTTWREFVSPNEQDVKLCYPAVKVLATGVTHSSVRFTPNSAYDVDPTLGSTSTPGFASWAGLFGYYRVVGFDYEADFVNTEALPIVCYSFATNTDPGTTMQLAYVGNPLTQTMSLAAKGGMDRGKLTGSVSIAHILGSRSVEQADSLRALTNASPADLVWLGLGCTTITGANLAVGVAIYVKFTLYVRFYDRLAQLS